ncbi:MAG TPA: hypothetical protein VLI54_05825 [Bacillota bacterium]|nr:hypothetical protein [Bacillota bacterium]
MFSFFHNWHLHLMGLIALLLQAGTHGGAAAQRPLTPDSPPITVVTQPVVPPPVNPSPPSDPAPLPDPPQPPVEQPIDPRPIPPPDHCGGCGAPGATMRKGPVLYCPMIVCYD